MNKVINRQIFVFILTALPLAGISQFYNGHQMSFGKNRVQYNEFVWSFYRFERFDVYFNEDGKNLADYTSEFAQQIIPRIEAFFDYTLERRIQFVVYNRLTDFRQSNIGLVTGMDEYNIGGTTNVNLNKAFLYFEGDYEKFDEQITAVVTRVIINEMLNGADLANNVANSTLTNIPKWYVDGLVAYLSKQWDIETENRVKDGIVNEKYRKFNKLTGEDAIYAGHSFWKYIADTYGETVIPSIIYLTSVSKSTNAGFSNVLGFKLKELTYEWVAYYMDMFSEDEAKVKTPDSGILIKRPKRNVTYQNIKISPTGNYVTYVTNDMGLYKIWLVNVQTGKKKIIFKQEYRLEQITDYSFPVIAWHSSARYIAFITEEKGGLKLYYYNIAEKRLTVRNFLYFDKVLDFSFSDEGSKFVFSGTRLGKTDIYVYDMASATYQQITNDIADDLYPRFIEKDDKIIFSSNRISDTIRVVNTQSKRAAAPDLFIYDYTGNADILMRLNDETYSRNEYPNEVGKNKFIQLSDNQGVINRYITKFDSTISFIDTTIHYRYYAASTPLTQYARNILEQDYNQASGKIAEIIFNNGRYYVFYHPLNELSTLSDPIELTTAQQARLKSLSIRDSLQNIKKEIIPISQVIDNRLITSEDTLILGEGQMDINNYIFEFEKINAFNEKLDAEGLQIAVDTARKSPPKIQFYLPVFYQNNLVSQVDFNFLNTSYQAFTGGAFYFNPGLNVLLKIGANDLFEDYKLTGGFRISPDFDANEYLISVENLKSRLDKQLIFYRQAFKNSGSDEAGMFNIKTHTNQLSLVLRYPFSQTKSFATTLSYRNDRSVYLSTDRKYLETPNVYRNWIGVKFEYIFDNTRSLGLNLYSGSRYKIFAEAQEQLTNNIYELVVFGADFRHYTQIHRSLIMANRFAWSTSQGASRIVYYLGGVDNWINLAQGRTPTFIPFTEIPIDETQNYVFQAVGTNMRGFSQNIRNGNNFFVMNNEIRFPVFKYFANHPLTKSFFETFQIVGFFDVGSAWSGLTPWSSRNAYDNDIIVQNPVTITIDANRNPIVGGFGVGAHVQLLGYFMRFDWAWGLENRQILPHVFYFSMSLDF